MSLRYCRLRRTRLSPDPTSTYCREVPMCAMSPRLLRPRLSFDPRRIAGLEAWWDASDSASVTLDGGRVSEWRDKSGNGLHAANGTSGSTQPDYISAGQNGRNLIRFVAASTQHLVVPSSTSKFNYLHNGSLSYVAAVCSFATTANPNAAYVLFANADGGLPVRGVLLSYDDRSTTSANDRLLCTVSNGTAFAINSGNFIGGQSRPWQCNGLPTIFGQPKWWRGSRRKRGDGGPVNQ